MQRLRSQWTIIWVLSDSRERKALTVGEVQSILSLLHELSYNSLAIFY